MLRGFAAAALIIVLAFGPGLSPAQAARSDEKLLSVARTTVYGALLGGLLGLASTLVVDEDHRGDAVRWGVALGTFGGFAYGIATFQDEDEFDDFSLRQQEHRLPGSSLTLAGVEGSGRFSALGYMRNVQVLDRDRLLSGIEVRNGGLEEEDGGEETRSGE
jgi:hypothetical protein